MSTTVGVVGLGQMGSAMALNLVRAGFDVVGTDLEEGARAALAAGGGRPLSSAREVAAEADRVVTSLPTAAALDEVICGTDGLLSAEPLSLTIIETSTLPLEVKERNRGAALAVGAVLLDCPLSGTGAQARDRDVVVYASGASDAVEACADVFDGFARQRFDLGEFGMGSRMKYVANLLVTIHNVAAAEALVLGMKAGLDPERVVEVISSGAGTSRMFEVRGPAMAANDYSSAGISSRVFQKDIGIIAEFAKALACPVPLFAFSSETHVSAVAQGYGEHDTAAVCAVLERLAGVERQAL